MELAGIIATLNEVRNALRDAGWDEWRVKAFNDALTELEAQAWQRGVDFAFGVAERERNQLRDLLLQVVATVDGKDRADGNIRYEVYPDPTVYGWKPYEER